MAAGALIEGLLADLQTIIQTAQAGVISKRDEVLELGETRPAAILFVDIVGFTVLARQISSELLTKVVDRTFRIFELTVRAHGGYCDKVIGDAALYVFAGHPNYAPVGEAALRAALKLKDRLERINESLDNTGVQLAIRQGVAFGEVTRQAVGTEHAQLTVMGDTVNQAQRLQDSAQPGAIQTTIRVLEKAGDHFQRHKVGVLKLKGIGEVTAYNVIGVEQQPVQLRGAFKRLTPLIGRDQAMQEALLKVGGWLASDYPPETWDIVRQTSPLEGRNRLLIVRGAPAVGKSRFAYELAERITKQYKAVYATGHCSDYASISALTAELAVIAGLTTENLSARWQELCDHAARAVSPEYAERQQQHVRLLGYVLGCGGVDAGAIGQADPKSFAINCQLAIRACCELIAHTGQRIVLIVEDLQWMGGLKDVISDIIARTCLPAPMVVIGTARPEYEHEQGMLGEGEHYCCELDQLTREQGAAIVDALLPGIELEESIAEELHEKAAGIPYFYEDFARMLVRKQLVAESNGIWHLTADITTLDIPEDIQTLMLGRLDQLEVELREVARRASVLGRSFERSLLAALERLLGYTDAGHPDDELTALTAEKLLVLGEGSRYFYEHVLLREAAYSSLLIANRRTLHSLTAKVLQDMYVPGTAGELDVLKQLVGHLEASWQYLAAHQRACELLRIKASMMSFSGWDQQLAHAAVLWDKAVAAGETQVPALEEGNTAAILKNQKSTDVKQTPDLDIESAGFPLSPMLHMAVTEFYYRKRQYPQAIKHAALVDGLTAGGGDSIARAYTLNCLGSLHSDQGLMDQARELYGQSLALFRNLGDRQGERMTLCNLGIVHKEQGRVEEAHRCYEQALALGRELGNRQGVGMSLECQGRLYRDQGRMEDARKCYEQALQISYELGNRQAQNTSMHNLGLVHIDQGRMAEAQACLEQSLSICRELGNRLNEGRTLNDLGNVYSTLGRMDEALACFEKFLEIARELGHRRDQGVVLHNLGWLYADLGDLDRGIACELEAMQLAGVIASPWLRGICQAYLGRLYAWQGRITDARAALEEGTRLLTELHGLYQLVLANCSWVYFHLATVGYIPEEVRHAHGAAMLDRPICTPDAVLTDAKASLARAEEYRVQISAGPDSEPGQETARAGMAIRGFALANGLDE